MYERSTIAELTFTEYKGGMLFGGSAHVEVQALTRTGKTKMFTQPIKLEHGTEVEFICADSDQIKSNSWQIIQLEVGGASREC